MRSRHESIEVARTAFLSLRTGANPGGERGVPGCVDIARAPRSDDDPVWAATNDAFELAVRPSACAVRVLARGSCGRFSDA